MRMLLAVLAVVMLGWTSTVRAGDAVVAPGDVGAIRSVIEQQLDAFKRDDGETAFGFASPGIRGMFGTAENFLGMVKTGYPAVYRPREVEFRDVVRYQGKPTMRVLLVGPDNVPQVAYYMMEQQPDGTWRIAGCVLMGAEDSTA